MNSHCARPLVGNFLFEGFLVGDCLPFENVRKACHGYSDALKGFGALSILVVPEPMRKIRYFSTLVFLSVFKNMLGCCSRW